MEAQEDLQPLDIKRFFAANGTLAKMLPGYQQREEQVELAQTIQEALYTQQHCLAEAGTGVGKSLAYLVPGIAWALENKARLLIVTHTKALQSQLMTKELPRLAGQKCFARDFRFEICLGAENYLCLLRLIREGSQEQISGIDPEYNQHLQLCLHWCEGEISGIRADLPKPVSDALWQRVCVINDLCIQRQCPQYKECYLLQARKRQREADVLVANHYLFFSNLMTEGRLLPEYKAVILDEAHKLEDVATRFLGDTLAQFEVLHLLSDMVKRGKVHILDALQDIDSGLREKTREKAAVLAAKQECWWKSLLNLFHSQSDMVRITGHSLPIAAPDTELIRGLAQDLTELQESVGTEEEARRLAFCAGRLTEMAGIEQTWFERVSQESVYWTEKIKTRFGPQVRLNITPLDLSDKLAGVLFGTEASVVLTSATLAVEDDFSYVRSRLGIPEALEVVTHSPFPFQEHAAIYLPTAIPDPKHVEAYEKYILTAVETLINIFAGGVFVLCTSYRMLHRIAGYLREQNSRHMILVQGEAAPQRLIDYFQRDSHAVMLGVETFWQGVDIPGEALRCVVITRLPFDVPTHPIHQARAEYLTLMGENPFMTYSIPRAALMLRQGFGRLIRSHADRGIVAIMDPRIQTRGWGQLFLDTLPQCSHLQHMDQVRNFVSKHFSQENVVL
ncbi:ATP-dependent DNA helicase [bacterium]|nr:ATP-dependent DNA helicase [bacterium]